MKLHAQIINEKKSGYCPVYIICYVNRERCRFATGVEVLSSEFDHKAGAVKGKVTGAKDKNLLINNTKKIVTEIAIRYRLQNKELTAELLRNEFQIPHYNTSFYGFYEVELAKRKTVLSPSMIEKYEVTLKKLKGFRPEVLFSDLDVDFLNDYAAYCRKLGNCQNTINANLRNIKTFIKLAYRKKLIIEDIFTEYKISNIKPLRNFLTEKELAKVIDYFRRDIFSDLHQAILQPFLFACFTGLRFSDVEQLRFDHIIDDFIVITPQKTSYMDKKIKIPLCQAAKNLIDFDRKKRKVFDIYSSQYINRELKNICDSVGIKKNITFHCARHTFATMYLRKTNDLAGLQKMLGHYSINETMIYAHALDDDIQINIKQLDTVFN